MPKKKHLFHNLPTILEELLLQRKMTDAELARSTGLPFSSVTKLRLGYTSNPTIETLMPICRFFNISIEQILGLEKILDIEEHIFTSTAISHQVPIIEMSEINDWLKNSPNTNYKNRQNIVTGLDLSKKAFAILVKGSMISELFQEGAILIFEKIDKNIRPSDRSYVIVILEEKKQRSIHKENLSIAPNLPTIKQIMYDGSDVFLGPFNPSLGGILTNPVCEILPVLRQTQITY